MLTVPEFMAKAKVILENGKSLEERKAEIGPVLSELSHRDDLTRFGLPIGESDASSSSYLMWREPPTATYPYPIGLLVSTFLPGYKSPVHAHEDFWVVTSVVKGSDQWEVYERLDDKSVPGYSELKHVETRALKAHDWTYMPAPPRAIHSHTNVGEGHTMELFFFGGPALPPEDRLYFDVDANTHWPSGFEAAGHLKDPGRYPPRPAYPQLGRVADRLIGDVRAKCTNVRSALHSLRERAACPLCTSIKALSGSALTFIPGGRLLRPAF